MSSHPVSFRFSPSIKALLEAAAVKSHRSQANLLEHLLLEHCRKEGISLNPTTTKKSPSNS